MRRLVLLMLVFGLTATAVPATQSRGGTTRRIATVTGLVTFPLFYHLQPVRVRGNVREEDGLFRLEHESSRIWLTNGPSGRMPDPGAASEVTGTFMDVGRLDPADGRSQTELAALSQRAIRKNWPGVGELLVLIVDGSTPAEALAAPSVRALALEPERYVDQEVTVVGRFRGRNLYGDLADGPGKSRWDFVLQSADAAIWVTGRRPRGDGFDLNIDNRVDTGRWLEVAGPVKVERGLVRIEATAIRAAQPPAQVAQPEAVVKVPIRVPPPEVIFSAPTEGETEVEPTAAIRIQFSRDLRAESIRGQVAVSYLGATQPAPEFASTYDPGRRMLEIKFAAPLEPFRTVQIALKSGIEGTDGQALGAWTLTFSVGS